MSNLVGKQVQFVIPVNKTRFKLLSDWEVPLIDSYQNYSIYNKILGNKKYTSSYVYDIPDGYKLLIPSETIVTVDRIYLTHIKFRIRANDTKVRELKGTTFRLDMDVFNNDSPLVEVVEQP